MDVIVVGHSIGGYVARLTKSSSIKSILTLATPHKRALLAWEPTLLHLHRQLSKDKPLVSICGGWRDEMIPPAICEEALTLSAVDLMLAPVDPDRMQPTLGMDHQAIVWCHNLLEPVRWILYQLVTKPSELGLHAIESRYRRAFPQSVREERAKIRVSCIIVAFNDSVT